jgi:nitric oxide synthase oxygenase domain/subunit
VAPTPLEPRRLENGDRIKPTITIFAPDAPNQPAPRLRNGQIVAYAGYKHDDGSWPGDGGTLELSARDFSDEYRYNLLSEIAEAFGIDTSDRRSLWPDRAVIELTTAVLHTYDQAGMRMDDHYPATKKFHKWFQAEAKQGREVQAEWTWMIPPISASLTPVFHQEYSSVERLPNFVASPRSDVAAPAASCPFTGAAVPA